MSLTYRDLHRAALALALLLCAGCGGLGAPPSPVSSGSGGSAAAVPSPTIAAAPSPAPSGPTPSIAAATSPPTRPVLIAPDQPGAESGQSVPAGQSIYLWPAYVPSGLRPAPAESRVAREGELGPSGLGFYIVTLNDGDRKLSIGGGDIQDVLQLAGEERRVTVGGRAGRLIVGGERREIVFEVPTGKLYIYSVGLSEDELLKVAGSLQPTEVGVLRELVGER